MLDHSNAATDTDGPPMFYLDLNVPGPAVPLVELTFHTMPLWLADRCGARLDSWRDRADTPDPKVLWSMYLDECELPGPARGVLRALTAFVDADSWTKKPTDQAELARRVGMSVSTVGRMVALMARPGGPLTVKRTGRGHLYRLSVPGVPPTPRRKGSKWDRPEADGGPRRSVKLTEQIGQIDRTDRSNRPIRSVKLTDPNREEGEDREDHDDLARVNLRDVSGARHVPRWRWLMIVRQIEARPELAGMHKATRHRLASLLGRYVPEPVDALGNDRVALVLDDIAPIGPGADILTAARVSLGVDG